MMGTINCCYETPCGWCSRFDKKCERSSMRRLKVYHSKNDWEHCAFLDNGKCLGTKEMDPCQKEKCEHVKLEETV